MTDGFYSISAGMQVKTNTNMYFLLSLRWMVIHFLFIYFLKSFATRGLISFNFRMQKKVAEENRSLPERARMHARAHEGAPPQS